MAVELSSPGRIAILMLWIASPILSVGDAMSSPPDFLHAILNWGSVGVAAGGLWVLLREQIARADRQQQAILDATIKQNEEIRKTLQSMQDILVRIDSGHHRGGS